MSSITGLILAAGRGSRMGGATSSRPKGLSILAGRTLIDWQSAALAAGGVSPVVAVGGYKAEVLREVIDVAFVNSDWQNTNMVASLICASRLMEQTAVCVSYSDIVYHPDHVRRLVESSWDIAICYDRLWRLLWEQRFDDPLSDAESFAIDDDRLSDIGRNGVGFDEIDGQYMGLIKVTPAGWSSVMQSIGRLDEGTVATLDMTSLLSILLSDGVTIGAVPVDGHWCEVDSLSDLNFYESQVADVNKHGAEWTHDWRWPAQLAS